MTVVDRLRYLRVVLVLAGLACLALYPLCCSGPPAGRGTSVTRTTR